MNDETEIRDNNHGEKKSLRKYCSEVSPLPLLLGRGDDDDKKEEI